ncbi:FecCD family ABC transporter permease [Terribacillus halophilus]|uniref:FecCD family ABC transporter permease n=1 Tax=Terribacillus halophilus TaxID=361279 RepID=UPI0009847BC0|nr:iron ABC transporter permease [Terribacillus halophilus]
MQHKLGLKLVRSGLIILAFLLLAIYLHITSGSYTMTLREIFRTLFGLNDDRKLELVIFQFRLPRIVIGALVGAGLGIAGAVMQGVTRNGLADPGILGINAGAGTAIVVYIFFFQEMIQSESIGGWLAVLMMPIFGFIGGLLVALLIFVFSWRQDTLDMQRLILTGIALGTGFGALSLYISLKMNANDFEMAAVWTSGSIYNANWIYIYAMLPWIICLGALLYRKSYLLNYFQLHDNSVRSLGIRNEKEKAILLLASIGLVSACVSVSGGIAFVGLIAPHISRRLVGNDYRYSMPISALTGMVLLVFCDYIAKTVFAPAELAVGIAVSIIGVPYFLYLLARANRGGG